MIAPPCCDLEGSRSSTAEGGWRISATAGGILWLSLARTLRTFVSNFFDSIQFQLTFA